MSIHQSLQTTVRNTQQSQYTLKSALAEELVSANLVISSAVRAWELPERLKRLSLPLLHYTEADLADYEILLCCDNDRVVAMAAWDNSNIYRGPGRIPCALLHGLYVCFDHQGCGLGQRLQTAVSHRAAKHGFRGLLVKSQRVSTGYFAHQDYQHTTDFDDDYPYLFWKPFTR